MKILNIGSINNDNVYQVPHFVQPGETLIASNVERFAGGKGFNQSVAVARAVAGLPDSVRPQVFHLGHVGADGAWLVDFLRAEKVNVDFVTALDDVATASATIQVDPSGQNCILISSGANMRITADDVRAALGSLAIGPGDVVLLQNETSATADIIRLAAATGATVAFNAAPMTPQVLTLPLECVSLFIVNELEGAALAEMPAETEGGVLLEALRRRFPNADVVLTLGANGAMYGTRDDRVLSTAVPARTVRAIDTTAAGDTFIGYFLAARAAGLDNLHILDRASAASAVCVSRKGAAPSIPFPDELALPWDRALLHGATDKDPVSYRLGETITFTLSLENPPPADACEGCTVHWSRSGDDGRTESGSCPVADLLAAPLKITTSLDRPGFAYLGAKVLGPDGRPVTQAIAPDQWWIGCVSFDGAAGVEIDSLRGEPEPDDFDAFWQRLRDSLAAVPLRAKRVEIASPDPEVRVFEVAIDCAGPRPATGYLSIPVNGGKYPVAVQFIGYGTKRPVVKPPLPHDVVRLEINAHGYDLGREPAYYNDFFSRIGSNGHSYAFDPEQNSDPESAYFHGMALRVLRAVEFVQTLPEWNGRDVWVCGGSQGGLQSLWGAANAPGVTKAKIAVPWCCDFAGANAGRLHAAWSIPYVPALDYYDPINQAKRITCEVEIERAGLGDMTCPASGIAILFNNLRCKKSIRWVQGGSHGYVPPEPCQVAVRKVE